MAEKTYGNPSTKRSAKVIRQEDGFDLPRLDIEDGTAYGWFDRWQVGTTPDGKLLTDFADWEARDLFDMLQRDYKARQVMNVLSLPIMSAEYNIVPIKGDTGEAEWLQNYWGSDPLQGGCRTSLDQIIGLCTSAFAYKRAYFEKVWTKGTGQFDGKVVYNDIAFRPQTTCRIMREPITGRYAGFEQEAYYLGPEISRPKHWPIQIPSNRAFVYTHGVRHDPLNGVSDLEIAFWAYKTKQKVMLLWFQYLQGVALPRTIVKANDEGTARNIAREVSRMKGSGVLPVAVPGGPQSVGIETLDMSGKGADQFKNVIDWLDSAVAESLLAGFLNLTGNAAARAGGHGSYALSADASDFFIQTLEAKTRELEWQIRYNLFAPLIYHNFGPNAAVPKLQFEPLNDIDKTSAIQLLQAAIAAPPGGPVPSSFVAGLAQQVAGYLGLDADQVGADFKASFDAAAAQAKAEALQNSAPQGMTQLGQNVAGLAGAVEAAHSALKSGAEAGAPMDAKKTLGSFQKAHAADAKAQAEQGAAQQKIHDIVAQHTDAALAAKTGGAKTLGLPARNAARKPPNARGPRTTSTTQGPPQQGEQDGQ